jgi:hypothetical protein
VSGCVGVQVLPGFMQVSGSASVPGFMQVSGSDQPGSVAGLEGPLRVPDRVYAGHISQRALAL